MIFEQALESFEKTVNSEYETFAISHSSICYDIWLKTFGFGDKNPKLQQGDHALDLMLFMTNHPNGVVSHKYEGKGNYLINRN